MSTWSELKEYINNNEIIIKKDLRNYISYGSSDTYICYIMNAKYIERIGSGQFKRIKKIPDSCTLSLIRKIAYDLNFQRKFIRKEKLINLSECQLNPK
jgi:hypothetical protein